MAGTTGFEPATSDVTGRRSNQTELRPRMHSVDVFILAWAVAGHKSASRIDFI